MDPIELHGKHFYPFITADEIRPEVKRLASELFVAYGEMEPLFVGVLNGAFMFMADLLRYYPGKCHVCFVKMHSYSGMQSTGKVTEVIGLSGCIKDRPVVLIEEIVDTGNTIVALHDILKGHDPGSLKVATLFFKPQAYKQRIPIDFIGKEIENKFIVGYGLDYNGLGRNLPDIYVAEGS